MNDPDRPMHPTRVRYHVLAVGCGLAFLVYLQRQGFVNARPEIQKSLSLDQQQMSYLQLAFLLGYGLFQVPCGVLCDRIGARHLLTVLIVAWSLLTGFTSLAQSLPAGTQETLWFLVGTRFLFGAAQAGFFPIWSRVMTDWMPTRERATAQGTVWMFSRLGGAAGPFLFLWLFQWYATWTTPLWMLGLFGIVCCVPFWFWFRNRPDQMPQVGRAERELITSDRQRASGDTNRTPWGALLRSQNVWALCLMYGFVGSAGNFITNLLPDYLRNQRGLSPETSTSLTGLPFAVGIVSCAFGGILSDWITRTWGSRKWGRRFNGAFGLILAGAAIAPIPWVGPVWLLAFLLSASFFFNDLNMGPAWAACADVGEHYAGTISGAMNMTGQFLGAAGMAFAGYMLRRGFVEPLFLFFGTAYVLAALCWLAVDVTKPLRIARNDDAQG